MDISPKLSEYSIPKTKSEFCQLLIECNHACSVGKPHVLGKEKGSLYVSEVMVMSGGEVLPVGWFVGLGLEEDVILTTSRNPKYPRVFKTLDAVNEFMQSAGVFKYDVFLG